VRLLKQRILDWMLVTRIHARKFGFVIADVLIVSLALYLAYFLRFDGLIPEAYLRLALFSIPLSVGVKIPILIAFRLYRFSWRYVGVQEMVRVFFACTIGSTLLAAALYALRDLAAFGPAPRSIFAIDLTLCILGIGGMHVSRGFVKAALRRPRRETGFGKKRALIVGAGDAGTRLARSLIDDRLSHYVPVGFLDDDRRKWGLVIHGIEILGGKPQLRSAVRLLDVEAILIAVPSKGGRLVRDIVAHAREASVVDVQVVPPVSQLYGPLVGVQELREVTVEDLLRRDPVQVETTAISQFVRGRSILVTGAAGSIGSELCRQVLRFEPERLVCLDHDETGLFYLEAELERRFPSRAISYHIGDIRDRPRIREVLGEERPAVVFHAAAYKHVPLMERFPGESVKTNIFGTQYVLEEASAVGTEAFVLISSDKAVNPCSIMGATKRAAELITHAHNRATRTRCLAVRFGNVLGSRGSVLPIFEEQILRGGPVTITDPGMQRYLMVLSEAVLLVLQAGSMGRGGEVFVLKMGEPISILELAQELIRSHGLRPGKDIPLSFTGVRPGERLSEELLTAEERKDAKMHGQILTAWLDSPWESYELERRLRRLREAAEHGDCDEIVLLLRNLVASDCLSFGGQPGFNKTEG